MKEVSDSASNLLKKYLKRKRFPTFSPSYSMEQSCYYQWLRLVFYELLKYERNDRETASEVVQLLEPTKVISYFHCHFNKLQWLESIMKIDRGKF